MKRTKVKWEYPACNLCGSKRSSVLLSDVTTWEHKGRFRLVKCKSCGLVLLNPRPKKKFISKFYPKESYWEAGGRGNWREERDKIYEPLYKYIFEEKKKGKILDVGAGTGLFLTKFLEKGWEIEGVELSREASVWGKERYKINLKIGDFLDLEFPNSYFDVITFNNSLEHLYNPRKTLGKVNKVLNSDGILVITVPNIESLGARIFGKEWYPLQPPRHLYHFTIETLTRMLDTAGFKIKKIDDSYWEHNYYSLFESFRFCLSPRFRKNEKGGVSEKADNIKDPFSMVLLKEIGKIVGEIFAFTIAKTGALIKRGEVISVYAKKT